MSDARPFRCGTVALAGPPNAGKSTLLNALVGQKLSIVTPKAQTTRHRILGILNRAHSQMLLLDTPGLHASGGRGLNKAMLRTAIAGIAEADVVVQVADATHWDAADEAVLEHARQGGRPLVLALNKVDRVKPKARLLPVLQRLGELGVYAAIIPMCALRGDQTGALADAIEAQLPEGPALFPDDQVTDRSERFLAAEILREKLMLNVHDELPYGIAVEIERFDETEDGRAEIDAVIWVERDGQKKIVVGKAGERLKAIGRAARLALNEALGRRVHLRTWVKVREGWTDNERLLRELGHDLS